MTKFGPIIYVFYYLLITEIINSESLIISNGTLGLEINYGEELTIQYKTKDAIKSHTGEFLGVFEDSIILDKSSTINQNFSELKIDIGCITSLKTKVAPSGSLLKKIENYIRIFGISAGVASAGYVIAVGDWSDGIGLFIGLIVTPMVGMIGAFGGGGVGVILAILSHHNKYSKPTEYKLQDDNWKMIVQ